ncbi:MAG: DUF5667 domain-containing protein [Chloroflexota bacterium]
MSNDDKLDARLAALLDEIKPASARDPKLAARARSRFLAEAVSASQQRRHSVWTIFQRKEQFAMNVIVSTLVIAGLLFGGTATVSAAQDDLPNQPLYQVKLASEEVELFFTSDPVAEINMLMEQAQTRTQEMAALAEDGITPPAELTVRARQRIQQALQIAANLSDDERPAALEQIRMRLQTQEQLLNQLQNGSCADCEPVLQQTREMLQNQLRQVESGIADPGMFQNQNQNQNQFRITQTPLADPTDVTPQSSCTPALDGTGQQNGNTNQAMGTPMPQNGQPDSNDNGSGNGSGGGNGDSSGQGGRP